MPCRRRLLLALYKLHIDSSCRDCQIRCFNEQVLIKAIMLKAQAAAFCRPASWKAAGELATEHAATSSHYDVYI